MNEERQILRTVRETVRELGRLFELVAKVQMGIVNEPKKKRPKRKRRVAKKRRKRKVG